MEFTVRVVDSDGNAEVGRKVRAHYPGVLSGGWEDEYTDDDGEASFSPAGEYSEVSLTVSGEDYGPYDLEDGATFTVEL